MQIYKFHINSEFLRFVVVGIIATAIHYIIYWILSFYIHYNVAYTIGYGLSFICNFFLTAYFTFQQKATVKKGIGFGMSHLCNYLIQMGLLNFYILVGINKELAPFFVYLVAVPISFILVRFVFRPKKYSTIS